MRQNGFQTGDIPRKELQKREKIRGQDTARPRAVRQPDDQKTFPRTANQMSAVT